MYAFLEGVLGTPPNGLLGANSQDTDPKLRPGYLLVANDPWWGTGEFVYGRANGSIRAQGFCVATPTFDSASQSFRWEVTEVPNTANLGRMLAVNVNGALASGNYGWFQVTGVVPVDCNANVAADTTFGIAAAGQGGANSAGKQVLNARVVAPGTTTVAKTNCRGQNGASFIDVPNSDGWFPGVFLSGTGVGASARVLSIEPGGRRVNVSVVNSALITGTVTATYNNATIHYNVAHLNRSFAQGAIT